MKVKLISSPEDELEYPFFEIHIDDKLELSFCDGEPEDNNMCRNFNDVYSIPDLLRKAYEAGKAGESFEVESEERKE